MRSRFRGVLQTVPEPCEHSDAVVVRGHSLPVDQAGVVLSRFTASTMSGYRENPHRRGRRALHHHRVHHPSGEFGWILFFALALA